VGAVGRPDHLVAVVGTGTEVGKTWVTASLVTALEGELATSARKPAQSFDPADAQTDADALATVTGEEPEAVCVAHRWYATPMAPPMAAEALGLEPFSIADLVGEIEFPAGTRLGLVEGAGGVASPLADDGDNAALVDALDPDGVIIVADAGLGTINSVRLSLGPLQGHRVVVYLNHFDPDDELHRRNRAWLSERDGCEVDTTVGALADRCRTWCRHAPDQVRRS
jgi:dethiobiotin synthase